MNNFPKIVALVGVASPFTADNVKRAFKISGGKGSLELWGINRCYLKQNAGNPPLSRLYFADRLDHMRKADTALGDDFCESLNALDVPVYALSAYPEIPASRPIPVEILIAAGMDYFTSTVAYAFAHAIVEGADIIMLHDVALPGSPREYTDQKPCLEFWTGLAMGRGIRVACSENSVVGKAYPWQARRYGFYPEYSDEDRAKLRQLCEMGLAPRVTRDRSGAKHETEPQLLTEGA